MKRFALCAAIVALMAAPLLAEPAPIRINANSEMVTLTPYDGETRDMPGIAPVYDAISGATTGWWGFAPTGANVAYPSFNGFIGDDLHMSTVGGGVATSFTHFHYIYFNSRIGPFSTVYFHSSLALFATNPNFSGSPVIGPSFTGYIISSLPGGTAGNPGGGWQITINGGFAMGTDDIWMFLANNELVAGTGGSLQRYALSDGGPVPGATHPYIVSGSVLGGASPSFFTLTVGASPLEMAFGLHVPEPVSVLLLAGGLLALRRRK